MAYIRTSRQGGGIGCLIFSVLFLVATFYILKGVFTLLWWAAPVLFLLALIINWRAVADTGREFLGILERNPLGGLLLGALAVVGFPVLALFLFVRALGYQKVDKFKRSQQGQVPHQPTADDEFIEFEEIESRPKDTPPETQEPITPPQEPEKEAPKQDNPYDDMFK